MQELCNLEKEFLEYGFSFNEYQEIIHSHSLITMTETTTLKHFKENNSFFEQLGYTKEEIRKMANLLPAIYGYDAKYMEQKIENFISLGYLKEEIIKMTKISPFIYGCSPENIRQKN